jgi:hypothetical protein
MKIAIHQPQYHPWLNYYRKIAQADIFVLLDEVQFQKNGIQNRNKIKTNIGDKWITIPVKQSLDQKISAVESQGVQWKKKHYNTIKQNYKNSHHIFDDVYSDIYQNSTTNLSQINRSIIEATCQYFGINTKIISQSELTIKGLKSDLIINICKKLKCDTYISGQGALSYLIEEDFQKKKIAINFIDNMTFIYDQYHKDLGFIPDLSALDFILNTKSTWHEYIKF